MAETTFTFKDATGTTKTALAGQNGSSQLAPSAVLYDSSGAELKGQKTRAASVPTALSTEDAALLADLLTNTTIGAIDFATQTTLAAINTKIPASPATAGNQTTGNTSLASIDGKLTDVATQTTLAAVLAKLIAAPATEAKQDSTITLLTTQSGYLDGLETLETAIRDRLGEVQASPTSNTVLDRLKTLATLLNGGLPAALGTGGGLKVDGSGTALPVSAASLPLPSGAATDATLSTIDGHVDGIEAEIGATNESAAATDTSTSGLNGLIKRLLQRVTTLLAVFPTTIDTNSGNKSASTLRVVLATDQPALTTPMPTKETRTATPAQSSVAGSASNASLLASNSSRLGATIYNDSSALLYVKLGATASATSFTVLLSGNGSGVGGYYEVPYGYTGAIDGIWASATGNARITEFT